MEVTDQGRAANQVNNLTFPVDNSFPTDLWVELGGESVSVGDVGITMSYAGATDTVSATAIWMKSVGPPNQWPAGHFMTAGAALPADADVRDLGAIFARYGQLSLVDKRQVIAPAKLDPTAPPFTLPSTWNWPNSPCSRLA